MDNLPRKLKKKEADKTPAIMQWFLDNYPEDVAVEVKMKGNKVKLHQNAALNQVKDGKFAYKIRDMGQRNPLDFIVLKKAHPFKVFVEGNRCVAINKGNNETFIFTI